MDHQYTFDPPPRNATSAVNIGRGARILIAVVIMFALAFGAFFIMTISNTATNFTNSANYNSLKQRFSWISGKYNSAMTHALTFTAVYDSQTLVPVLNPYEIFFGLASGAPPAVIKGRVELLYASDASDSGDGTSGGTGSLVRYNVTVAHPGMGPLASTSTTTEKLFVRALELVVTNFNARTDHLIERTSVVLCGGPIANGGSPCSPQGAKKDNFYGTGVLPAVFETVMKADEMHTTLFMLIFMNNGTLGALHDEDVKFVVELDA